MTNSLADAISPYLRSHADNPVAWYGWGVEAFVEARLRDVPVLVSIGYSTCHWCHVMARESFSDPELADYLNRNFVSIKVDREEHPEVDASYLAAASAFVSGLGWPLNVFVTPDGQAFYAGTYFPPLPLPGHPSFRQVLDAVTDAWTTRRAEVTESATRVAEALAAAAAQQGAGGSLPGPASLDRVRAELVALEDPRFGGFGGAPKFPVAPVLGFLLGRAGAGATVSETAGSEPAGIAAQVPGARALALRTLKRMGASPLRDPVEGGFFRYAVNRDWSDPHYERMLYDNAQLLDLYTQAWRLTGEQWARTVAEGVAGFLTTVLSLPGGGFASAQDSESTVAGRRVEGVYYTLDEDARRREEPPALDEKVLTGWNGLAIAALARAGFAFADPSLTQAAATAADHLLDRHLRRDGSLVRASIAGRTSAAQATLEDFGMCALGLLELALATGEVRYATAARRLIDGTLGGTDARTVPSAADTPALGIPAAGLTDTDADTDTHADADGDTVGGMPFRATDGPDPVLEGQGLALDVDPSEGAYPSGITATAEAANLLYQLTADDRYRTAAAAAMAALAERALERPLAFGATLRLSGVLTGPVEQLLVVRPDTAGSDSVLPDGGAAGEPAALLDVVRRRGAGLVASVTEAQAQAFADAGFELFRDRVAQGGRPTAYLCRDFVCRLPVTDPADLPAA
ncbi:thioredoxin domain-containing protein [Cryobacterium sinapicolor]|uniref:Thioredoxin domain-containing protein n=1 Tax=Cryobacterium sinapicolor TaxID=1259236 RepID=A0ABY2ITE7_9MICO|nr:MULTISPECIES: DUF255 domain-containing protein [Cryobacterium]TFC93213.1 thioredoxin domain-containing protein [Cryobacterium sp. TMT3-29-2]TFC94324.1 thioredoxin domain-containing protein [Cryobacterium sinapicolor]